MSAEEHFHEHHQRLIDTFQERRDEALANPEDNGQKLVDFLRAEILPHAQAEEEVLYAEIDRRAGTELATGTMRFEHKALSDLMDQLDDSLQIPETLQRLLRKFSSLLLNHFEKEEAVLIPYLGEQMTEVEFLDILHEIHSEEEERKSPVGA